MTHSEIRRRFINFFVRRGHLEIPPSSLVPDYDPTLLLTNSGMAPLKPYFLGQAQPPSRRLVNVQKCVRTNDIESVGDIHHLTFFEMLGNWSLGEPQSPDGIGALGYFKKEAIQFAWDLLEEFGIDRQRIWIGVFGGDPRWPAVPADEESENAWLDLGLAPERVLRLPTKDSFWFSGPSGPCGPNTDILYDLGQAFSCGKPDCGPTCDCGRFLEIWNAGVFMMYNRQEDGSFATLPAKNVDAGAGLERFALVLQKVRSVYETDLFASVVDQVKSLAEISQPSLDERSVRVITDHLRAATFLAGDGVVPSNTQRGYILRRLIRRAILHGHLLKIDGYFLGRIAQSVIDEFTGTYPDLSQREMEITRVIEDEERAFGGTLQRGLAEFNRLAKNPRHLIGQKFDSAAVFRLYDSYGFPFELTEELAREKNLSLNRAEFEDLLKKQKERSRQQSTRESFDPAKIKTAHTAAHLLNAALQKVLHKSVRQMGQRISERRFSHDFNFSRKLSAVEIQQVEELVNQKIAEDLPVKIRQTTFETAVREGAQALFEEKYKEVDRVTLYEIGDFSRELCGGPHVNSTGQIRHFRIVKDEAVSTGVRRIKAVVEG